MTVTDTPAQPGTFDSPRPRPVASDSKPWEPVNTDGRANMSSYAALAACGMIDLAHEHLARSTGALPAPDTVISVARGLLSMTDEIQSAGTGGRPDRMAGSHTRARGFLRATIDVVGLPDLDAPQADKVAWRHRVVEHASALFAGAFALVEHG